MGSIGKLVRTGITGAGALVALIGVGCGEDRSRFDILDPPPSSHEEPTVVSQVIDGSLGGVITNGRYLLRISPGAFAGVRTIEVVDPHAEDLRCLLYPEGLHFDAPVRLAIDLSGTDADVPGMTVEWWDPVGEAWMDMGGEYVAPEHAVDCPLQHFSAYRPRAGWRQ